MVLTMDLQKFYGQGPNLLLWAASWVARGKITVVYITMVYISSLINYAMFIDHT